VDVTIRHPTPSDAAALTRLHLDNRAFLEPFDPVRPEGFYDEGSQVARVRFALEELAAGRRYPFVIMLDGRIVGEANLSNVVRGAWHSTNLGYWVSERVGGQGIASRAIGLVCEHAFQRAGLHRVEAGTLVDNVRSQRVLTKNGFREIGLARSYLRIAGHWQDHLLYERLADDPGSAPPG
jgi:ribosomal-protein-alanine N-acetyltransferase